MIGPRLRASPLLAAAVLAAAGVAAGDRAVAAEPQVSARVSADRIGEGDSLSLTVEVRGDQVGGVEEPDLSGLADFTVAAGPSASTSTSMYWSGGRATSMTSRQFTYVLLPRRRGSLTIPTISVRAGDRVHRTDPITVEVVSGSGIAPRRGRALPGPRGRGGEAETPAGEVLVEAQADRTEVYVGEQILLIYKVFTQAELAAVPTPQKLASYTGFWVEEIPNDPRASIHRVTRGGRSFVEITLMKKALFPTTSGALVVEESVFELPVRVSSRDPFDSLFFNPARSLYRKTTPITIHVKPLPAEGRPASFTGAVGRYTITAATDREQAGVNEAVGLRVAIEGTGNIRTVGEPALPRMADYKRYEPKVDEKKELSGDRLTGSKTWDYVLTPLAPGRQDIPPIRFAYFDPERGAYVDLASAPLTVDVQRSAEAPDSAGGTPPQARREVVALGRDIRYIKPASALALGGAPFHRSAAFATLLALPLIGNAGLLLVVRRRRSLAADAEGTRLRRAPAFARRRLKRAHALLDPARSSEFHQEVARALYGYLGEVLGTPAAGLTQDRADEMLAARGVGEPVREDLRRRLLECDYARFAPVPAGADGMRSLLGSAGQAIARLDAALRAGRST